MDTTLYSANIVANNSAESGTASWTVTNVTTTTGGTIGSNAFQLPASATMSQHVTGSITSDVRSVRFQISYSIGPSELAYLFAKVVVNYSSGNIKTYLYPLNGGFTDTLPGNVGNLPNTWQLVTDIIEVPSEESLASFDVTVYTSSALTGNAYVDWIELKPEDTNVSSIPTNSIDGSSIMDGTITGVKLATASVDTAYIADAAITTAKIKDANISTAKIADLAVTGAKIANATIQSANIQDATITGAKIASATIAGANIANATIDTAQIKNGAITTALLGTAVVDTGNIKNLAVTNSLLATGIDATKITVGTLDAGVVTVKNLVADNIVTGTITLASANLVQNSDFQSGDFSQWTSVDPTWTLDKTTLYQTSYTAKQVSSGLAADAWKAIISNSLTCAPGDQFVASVWTMTNAVSTIDRGAYLEIDWFDSSGTQLSNNQISCQPGSNNVWVRTVLYATAPANAASFKLRCHLTRNGTLWATRFQVVKGTLNSNWQPSTNDLLIQKGIQGAQVADGTITNTNIHAATITGDKLVANTITANQIAAATITSTQIASNTITAGNIAANTITANQIAAGTITATQIAASTITADRLSVTSLSAISGNIGTITAGTITGLSISGGTIDGAHITSHHDYQGTYYMTHDLVDIQSAAVTVSQTLDGNPYTFKQIMSPKNTSLQHIDTRYTANNGVISQTLVGSDNNAYVQTTSFDVVNNVQQSQAKLFSASSGSGLTFQGPAGGVAQLTQESSYGNVQLISSTGYIQFMFSGGSTDWLNVSPGCIQNPSGNGTMEIKSGDGAGDVIIYSNTGRVSVQTSNSQGLFVVNNVYSGYMPVYASAFTVSSDKSQKKNITKFDKSAEDIVNSTDVYQYNYHIELDHDLKHTGLIMQEAPMEVVDPKGIGVDVYAVAGILWKAVQELSARVKSLEANLH